MNFFISLLVEHVYYTLVRAKALKIFYPVGRPVHPEVVGTIVAAGILLAVEPRHLARRITRTH
ncbi:MAG: hypothetical protein FJ403_16645 [Verrucomicrobia bacterium]|nr:hypothetical protein [Verrucomicrobiota bacterium]